MPKDIDENEDKYYAAKAKAAKESVQPLDKTSPRFRALEIFFRGKSVLPRDNFKDLTAEKGKKAGSADGYLASDYADDHMYMIKTTSATHLEKEFLAEYLTAGVYQRALYDRAPDLELIQEIPQKYLENKHPEDALPRLDKNILYFRSKFLNHFKAIADIEIQAYESNDFSAFKTIEGFAKVIATCIWLGETDAHGYNLGVSEYRNHEANDKPKIERIAVKIDHGKAGCFLKTEEAMRRELFKTFNIGSRSTWQKGGARPGTYTLIDCKVSELYAALTEITKISDIEIESLISSRAVKLKKSFLISTQADSLSKEEIQKRLDFIEDRSSFLINGLINHRNIIKNDLLKTLEVIEMIGPSPMQVYHADKNGEMLINKPIEQLIEQALEASENPKELERLKEITEYFYEKIIKSSRISPDEVARHSALGQSKNWEALYEFEQVPSENWAASYQKYDQLPYVEQIKQLQQLEGMQKLIVGKIQSLQNNAMGYYSAYRTQEAQKVTQLEEEQMAWMIENHREEIIDFLTSEQENLRDRVLEKKPPLNNLYQRFIQENVEIYRILNGDNVESIKTLFCPTVDAQTKKNRALMIKFLEGNKRLYNRYYAKDKAEQTAQEHRYLLFFMENEPAEVRALLKNPGLDERDRARMLSVLESPSTERENKIASAFKKLPTEVEPVESPVSIHPRKTSIFSSIFSSFRKK